MKIKDYHEIFDHGNLELYSRTSALAIWANIAWPYDETLIHFQLVKNHL